MKRSNPWLVGVTLAVLSPAAAQAKQPPAPPPASPEAPEGQAKPTAPADQPNEVIVTGTLDHSERDVLSGTSVLSGAELTRNLQPTIGETLARQPGVSATSFGPNASRPILRGFQGDRIRVLTDGIGSIDVSNTSVDHAVVINPLLAERIEVLRGPAALLYGSSAVGGVVNVIDARIPRRVPDKGYSLDAIGTYGSAANERSIGASANVALGNQFVINTNGSYSKTDDLRIPGFALTPARRAEALATSLLPFNPADPDRIDFAGNAAIRGTLPNSASETWTAGVGAALITDGGSLGLSYGHYASLYGVPIRYATQIGQGQESPRIDIVQNRLDLRGEVDTGGGFIETLRLRAGYAAYRQFELEPDGAVATTFLNNGFEGRFEIIQARRGAWLGASGVQFSNREFNVIGDEAFLPRNATAQTGIFTQQQLDFGRFKAEAGARYEWTDLSSRSDIGDLRYFRGDRRFGAFSGAVGASYGVSDAVRFGLNLSRTERAPSAEELFANGSHAGTQAYELGNPDFRLEKSWGLEATLHAHGEGYSFDASAYYNWFSNFISDNQTDQAVCEAAAAPSGRDVDLPCFQLSQGDARYYGFEASGSVKVAQLGNYAINVDALGDYVRATLVGNGPAPRIPPVRVLGGIEAQSDRLSGRIEVEHVFAQNRVAAFETTTRDFTLVNFSAQWQPFADNKTTLTLSANNLFDADARRHASFLKDFAPLAGRDIRVTVRFAL
ncbi:MAG: TonB-dependent receptor [Sphingomonas sp.]|uniref:TonB-dependent receptor n=1 Tax=Sphingomonas sp. TaxID=28214 RepID=UPI0025FF9EA5|nr:TonB-dependent receptor [Sphingomonas sp.]MBY0282414.1 TonB-dependent receptor [Sphingomonas sp.]